MASWMQHLVRTVVRPVGGTQKPMSRVKLFTLLALALAAICIAPVARADTFTFNVDYCTNPCLGGTASANNGGTVTVTQSGTNIVDVKVALNNLVFHDQGLESFAFNISGNPTLTFITTGALANGDIKLISGGGSTWTFSQPAGNTDGAGSTFGYSLDCAGGAGACTGSPSTLEFAIDYTGLTPLSLETRSGANGTTTNVDFAANVSAGGGACTGMIGAGNGTAQSTPFTAHSGSTACGGTSTTPEPTSILFFGTGLLVAGGALRKKFSSLRQVLDGREWVDGDPL